MVSYDLMDAIKTPPDEQVFQHYVDSAGEAVEAFADKVTQVISPLCIRPTCCEYEAPWTPTHQSLCLGDIVRLASTGIWDGQVPPRGRTSAVQLLLERLDAGDTHPYRSLIQTIFFSGQQP